MSESIVISGTGLYTPEFSITNEELVSAFNANVDQYNEKHKAEIESGELVAKVYSDVAFIEKASGIKQRYVVEKSGPTNPDIMRPLIAERADEEQSLHCEVSVKAIEQALKQANKTPADVDAVIASCSAFPRMYPALAIEIQNALGIDGFAYDMNVACSSATFAIQNACNAIQSGSANCVVVVNPEITSPHLNYCDRDSHFIFGDVCTAIVLEKQSTASSEDCYEIVGMQLKTTLSNAIRNNFGYMNRCDDNARTDNKLFYQEGRKVFKEVVPMVAELITTHLGSNGIEPSQLKCLWLHQANINMNILIAKKILGREFEETEAPMILDEFANTASAGSIIAFHQHRDNIAVGDYGVICSFGAGYSIGNIIVKRCA